MRFLGNLLGNRGRHVQCSGHHIHLDLDRFGWSCCSCGRRFSAYRAQPASTGECRRPAPVDAAPAARNAMRIAVPEEDTVAINASRLRLAPDARAQLDDRGWYRDRRL